MSLLKLSVMVEKTLESEIDARNSDTVLKIKIWQRWYGIGETIELDRMFDLPNDETIRRIRRKIQNGEGRYVPTDWKVAKARGFKQNEWRNFLGYLPKGEETRQAIANDAEIEKRFREQTGAQGKLFETRGSYGGYR